MVNELSIVLSNSSSNEEDVNYTIRPMRRCDIDGLYNLTTENAWNMEKSYLECVFNTDPTGLVVVVKDDGEVIGRKTTNRSDTYNLRCR